MSEFEDKILEIKTKAVRMLNSKNPAHANITHYIATSLMELFEFKSLSTYARINPIYTYKNGIYVDEGRRLITGLVEKMLGDIVKTGFINEVANKIERSTYIDREILDTPPIDLICVGNGILDLNPKLKNYELYPHHSDVVFQTKIAAGFDKSAECPIFLKFLEEMLEEMDIDLLQEWFGFCLWRVYFEKKALVIIGPTNSGKTVIMDTLNNFLGSKNVSAVDLHELNSDKFASWFLYNKLANINDELTSGDLHEVRNFKKLTGRSVLSAEEKFKSRFPFVNYAKLTFATNKMPNLKDEVEDPQSYYNRWMTIETTNVIEEKDQNKQLTDEINTPKELSGILNWALEGLTRLKKNGMFSFNKHWRDTEKLFKLSGKSVYSFGALCIEQCNGNLVPKDEMFEAYLEYCGLNNKTPEPNKQEFGKKFKLPYMENRNSGKRERMGWMNVRIKRPFPVNNMVL